MAETEQRAGQALRELVEWCGETITVRDATRLRRLAALDGSATDDGGAAAELEPGARAGNGGARSGSAV